MLKVRKSSDRGHAQHGWLDSYHSFSFARYYDPEHMGYSVLRVINEDIIDPAHGFGKHSHQDMEIITYMLHGAIRHEDSMGNGSVIRAGDVQRMSAGSGVTHSEFNASGEDAAHLLQIWLLPERDGITPSWEEKHFAAERKQNQWCLIASRDARQGSLLIHQDVDLSATLLQVGKSLAYSAQPGRSLYVQVAAGSVLLNGEILEQGDAVAVDDVTTISLLAQANAAGIDAEVLLFDLPSAKAYIQ